MRLLDGLVNQLNVDAGLALPRRLGDPGEGRGSDCGVALRSFGADFSSLCKTTVTAGLVPAALITLANACDAAAAGGAPVAVVAVPGCARM
jgi:hypothetical protein